MNIKINIARPVLLLLLLTLHMVKVNAQQTSLINDCLSILDKESSLSNLIYFDNVAGKVIEFWRSYFESGSL